jgi:hypothetical protein
VNKAPGNDGIQKSLEISLKTFNSIFETNGFPDNWVEIVICPLFKNNNHSLPENYRPVSLTQY